MKKKTVMFTAAAVLTLTPVTAWAASTPGADSEPTIHVGNVGSAVMTLQRELNADGFSVGDADGIFGPNTLREVRAFQASENLTADGIVGPQTWNALLYGKSSIVNVVKSIDAAAMKGQLVGLPYVSGKSTVDEIETAWGQPTSQTSAGAGIYASFSAHNAAFGFNKGEQLFDLRSYAPNLHPITVASVEQVLGRPGAIHYYGEQTILMYPAGPNYQLQWVFDAPTAGSTTPHLDHISVFSPQATVDSMAATGPAPSLTIDSAPGKQGNQFTFTISAPLTGYAVSELEWIGSNGQSVVDTAAQADRNGSISGNTGFKISENSRTVTFEYPASMDNQAGQVTLIYQNSNGTAMIGSSETITLK